MFDSQFPSESAFGGLFTAVATLVVLGFLVVIGLTVWRCLRHAWATPMHGAARCVAKRIDVGRTRGAMTPTMTADGTMAGGGTIRSGHTTTRYHATFELADGQRLELRLDGRDYGLVAEGDRGILNWRDDVFQGFQRNPVGDRQRLNG